MIMSRECNDLSGMKFGSITVIKKDNSTKPSKNGYCKTHWICKCDNCGNIKSMLADTLRNKGIKSCGCIRINPPSKRRKHNKYDLSGKYGIGYTSNTNEEFYFDLEDYEKIKEYCWGKVTFGYLNSIKINSNEGKKVILHRLILGCDKGVVVDHINHNPLDNRKENLRIATQQQNATNTSKRINTKCKYIGVDGRFRKTDSKDIWCARITKDGKFFYLGMYEDIEDALIARLKAEKELFGEFAPQIFLFEKYGI